MAGIREAKGVRRRVRYEEGKLARGLLEIWDEHICVY